MIRLSPLRVFACALLTLAAFFQASQAHAQRIVEGPRYAPGQMKAYRISDERIRFIARSVEGVEFDRDALSKVAKRYAREAAVADSRTHVWDNKWYFWALPEIADRQKYLMVIAHNLVKDEMGWIAISNEGRRWAVMNNEGITLVPWNTDTVRFSYRFNGFRVDLDVYNPNEGGWTANHIHYRIGETLDPQIRLRDDQTNMY